MGINKFSIYSSFGNKNGLFLESIKRYKLKTDVIFEKFRKASNGVPDIKQFFYDSISSDYMDTEKKGCLITNTYNESSEKRDLRINEQMTSFMRDLKAEFIRKLETDTTKDERTVLQQANFLLLAKHGLAAASRVNTHTEIEDYIEMTFKNI
ncbi:TetR/AcrR family transcriptional regulator [Halpernia sp. GG3]